MAESTASVTWTTLYKKCAYFLGYGRPSSPPLSDAGKDAEVVECLDSGYRQYLNPPTIIPGKPAHKWSWLRPTATVDASGSPVDLPDGFAGMVGDPTVGNTIVQRLEEDELRAITGVAGSGSAKYYAIRPKAATVPTRWQILFAPASGTVTYRYQILPDVLTSGAPSPYGGAAYAELLEESVLAVAESRMDDETAGTPHKERFMQLLTEAISLDEQNYKATEGHAWPASNNSTTLEVTYYDLIREIAGGMGFPWNTPAQTDEQKGIVDSILQSAVRSFYFPQLPGQPPYQWTFFQPEQTLTTVAGTSLYSMPSDFGSLVGDFTWPTSGGAWRKIIIIPEARMRERLQSAGTPPNGLPRFAALQIIAPVMNTANTRYKVQFDQPFDNIYALGYVYRVNPPSLSSTNQLVYGGIPHAETIRQSCLAAVERRKTGKEGAEYAAFVRCLKASIDNDSQNRPNILGTYFDRSHIGNTAWGSRNGRFAGAPSFYRNGVLVTPN